MKRTRLFALVLVALMSLGVVAAMAQTATSTSGNVEIDAERVSKVATEDPPIQVAGAEPPSRLRVGTFDSRFVALAYYRSEHGTKAVRALQEEFKEARDAKNKKRVKELEARGPALQNLMHQQVFGSLSIPNVMKVVSASLPAVAAEAGVSLVVSKWDIQYSTPGIELVDLTEQLVELFELDDDTRRMIEKARETGAEPVPLDQLLEPHD